MVIVDDFENEDETIEYNIKYEGTYQDMILLKDMIEELPNHI